MSLQLGSFPATIVSQNRPLEAVCEDTKNARHAAVPLDVREG